MGSVEALQIVVALLTVLVLLRISSIQSGSTTIATVMATSERLKLSEIALTPVEDQLELKQDEIVQVLSFLNLVSKYYLSGSISVPLLRTWEAAIVYSLRHPKIRDYYKDLYQKFHEMDDIGEPPYVSLVYVRDMLIRSNRRLNRDRSRSYLWISVRLFVRRVHFRSMSAADRWTLCGRIDN